MDPIIERVTVGDKELTFDGRIVTFVQNFKKRTATAKFDVGVARWELKPYPTLIKRRKRVLFTIHTPPTADGAQMIIAEGDDADALTAFVDRVFQTGSALTIGVASPRALSAGADAGDLTDHLQQLSELQEQESAPLSKVDVSAAPGDAELQAAYEAREAAGRQMFPLMSAVLEAKASGNQREVSRLKSELRVCTADHQSRNAELMRLKALRPDWRTPGDLEPDAAVSNDRLDRLQKIGELHASGVLTDAEFAAQKAKLLDH